MDAICPECGATISLPAGTLESEIIVCPECGAELEVVSLTPAYPCAGPRG